MSILSNSRSASQTRQQAPAETHEESPPDPLPVTAETPEVSPLVAAARRELLGRISQFVVKHGLEVSSVNLAAVCSALSGSNAQLAEAFATREISGEPVDQRWLDTIVRLDPATNDRMSELEKLMDQLEYSLIRFGQTAKSAADETSDHRAGMDAQITAMADSADAGDTPDVERVLDISRAMLERVAAVENAMERSHAETDALRQSLAQARAEADVDHLTCLPNRRAFERRLASANAEARAKGDLLSVAFCDVDRFKLVNDTHGHEAGDRILCAVAGTLNEIASDECFIARHGGEEFVLLFYGLGKDDAWRKLDGVRRAMAMKQLMNRETGRSFGKVTFSGGVAEVTEECDPRSALSRADTALYQAKEAGRNQIIAI
ncbi:MAG: GGDEF domain-containing protein [Pseudomonadota bacterium]